MYNESKIWPVKIHVLQTIKTHFHFFSYSHWTDGGYGGNILQKGSFKCVIAMIRSDIIVFLFHVEEHCRSWMENKHGGFLFKKRCSTFIFWFTIIQWFINNFFLSCYFFSNRNVCTQTLLRVNLFMFIVTGNFHSAICWGLFCFLLPLTRALVIIKIFFFLSFY